MWNQCHWNPISYLFGFQVQAVFNCEPCFIEINFISIYWNSSPWRVQLWNLFHWNQSSTKSVSYQISFILNLSNKPGVKHANIWKNSFRAGTVYHPYTTRIPPVYLRIPPYTAYSGNTKVNYRILPYTSVYFRIPPYTAIVAILKLITVYFRILPYTTVYHPYTTRIPPYTTRILPVYHPYTTSISRVHI